MHQKRETKKGKPTKTGEANILVQAPQFSLHPAPACVSSIITISQFLLNTWLSSGHWFGACEGLVFGQTNRRDSGHYSSESAAALLGDIPVRFFLPFFDRVKNQGPSQEETSSFSGGQLLLSAALLGMFHFLSNNSQTSRPPSSVK